MQRRGLGRRIRDVLAIATVVVLSSAVVRAQGTPEQQDACRSDVFRLCSAYIPDVDGIVGCLRGNGPQLNPLCHAVFFPTPEPARRVYRGSPHRIRHHYHHH